MTEQNPEFVKLAENAARYNKNLLTAQHSLSKKENNKLHNPALRQDEKKKIRAISIDEFVQFVANETELARIIEDLNELPLPEVATHILAEN